MSLVEQGYQQHHNRYKLHLCSAAAQKQGGRLLSVAPFIAALSWPIQPQTSPEGQDASSFMFVRFCIFFDHNSAQTWKTGWSTDEERRDNSLPFIIQLNW